MESGGVRDARVRGHLPAGLLPGRGTANSSERLRQRTRTPAGFTLLELLLVVALTVVMASMAVATTVTGVQSFKCAAAGRYFAARVQSVRLEAAKRGRHVGLRFRANAAGTDMLTYLDGNGNGIRSADISRGTDTPVGPPERLDHLFSGVEFGYFEGVVDPDSGQLLSGDPIKLGSTDILSFSPTGSATSGTIYVRGNGRQQYALRILGGTGRVRLLRFDFQTQRWSAP